ncbi:hypothetical protein [Parapedobacter indicus]|uniref:Uncharacterized protein n=1 Tax=Parapedobacter indicus TaxID=1477437 RepID=A0A1I3V2Z3_9SPHI|nr:hypothetical protein [Parapedobacter indicus]PPK98982.1 hypothetical protein CLV26_11511 [Parapedobacter indicus]SFJ89615.1 hypothetical protein SAMN05444682_115166 [Parapedobacter indicus]
MWEKILTQLLSKHAGVPKVVLALIAKKLAEKVTDENQIEGAINDFEANSPVSIKDYADLLQSEGDKRVTEALKKAKEPTPPVSPTPPAPQPKDDEAPAWFTKFLGGEFKELKSEVYTGKAQKTVDELVSAAKAKGIPEKYARRYQIGEDFDAEKALAEIESEWTEIKQSVINAEVGDGKVVTGVKTSSTGVSDAIAKFAKKNVEAAASKAKE